MDQTSQKQQMKQNVTLPAVIKERKQFGAERPEEGAVAHTILRDGCCSGAAAG